MARVGFGFGQPRRQMSGGDKFVLAQSISQAGVTFTFSELRPTGQFANGDWWVQGPVTITAITPASFVQASGLNGDGTTYTNRTVHGTMVNPGHRSFAPGGLLANNTSNTVQGWDSIGSSKPRVPYASAANVDPGATGSPLTVTAGSVVKFVSALSGLPNGAENRPAGIEMTVLTVVTTIPAADAVRPGVSRAGSKASPCRVRDFDMSVFQRLAPTPSAPTYAQALEWVRRYHETSQPDSINNPVAKGINNHPEYGRDIGNNLHRALLCLHLSSFTDAQKLTLLSHLAAIADDLVSRAEEGALTLGGGGGNQWKKPVIAVCAAALGARAPASWLSYLSFANRNSWAEDSQIFIITGADVALPRFTADGRPRTAYTQQMLGSAEWGEQVLIDPARSGSNWDAFYRDIVAYSLYPGTLAVQLTAGAKALWDHPDLWLYMDTVYLRRTEGGPGNMMAPFTLEMTNAYRPAKTAVPVVVESGIKDSTIWVRFDQSLNEIAALPPLSSFTVRVNGTAVTINSVSIWRQNLGLVLAASVLGSDVVTISYTGTTNRVRSVDGVNIADIANRTLTNRTDKVGGPNAAFPVVRFGSSVVRTMGGTARLHTANTQVATCALLKFKFAALPTAPSRIFGTAAGAVSLSMMVTTEGRLEVRLQNSAAGIVARFFTSALSPNTEYDILWSVDMSQATGPAGINCYINGVLQTLLIATFTTGGTIGWSAQNAFRWNDSNNMIFEFGAFWLDPTARLDLTVATNRARFTGLTAGNLDILTRGDGITGSIPSIFLAGNADQWNDGSGINRGAGNKFFVTSGLVTSVSGSEWT